MDQVEETLCPITMGAWVRVRWGKPSASDLHAYLWGGGVFQDKIPFREILGGTGLDVMGSVREGYAQSMNSGSQTLAFL